MNSTHVYFALLLLIAIPYYTFSQNDENETYLEYSKTTLIEDVNQIYYLGIGLIQVPFHLNRNDLLYGLGVSVATSSLFLVDPAIKSFVLQNQSAFNDNIFEIDKYFNGRTGSFAASGLYIGGFLFKQEKIRIMGLHALETLFISGAITELFKYSFGRRRPYAGKSNMDFKAFRGSRAKYRAFPSGHTTNAFAFASVMAMSLDNSYWEAGWYSAAAMVGVARIYHNVHWISDIFLAALISYNVADFVVHFNSQENNNFKLYPSFNGIQIRMYF